MSFNRGNKGSKVVCRGQNHGCDEKPQGFFKWLNGKSIVMQEMFGDSREAKLLQGRKYPLKWEL